MSDQPQNTEKNEKKQTESSSEFFKSLVVALAIALVIRALVIYPFRIPTGSMKDTLLVGDFLLANKFVYGIRTPDWIGIPYTKVGFKIPYFRTPGFRLPKQGNVVIFKYPRDDMLNYIKRCIATSGDTVLIRNKTVYVNGVVFPNPPKSRFISSPYPEDFRETNVFPPGAGNRDNYGPVIVPSPGDTFGFSESNKDKWFERFQLAVYEGHKLEVKSKNKGRIRMTVENQHRWMPTISYGTVDAFLLDDIPLKDVLYTVKNRHYFLMGDNRDNSLDSRYWGFLPERYVVGEALIVYFSWNSEIPGYQLLKKIRFLRILKLIR